MEGRLRRPAVPGPGVRGRARAARTASGRRDPRRLRHLPPRPPERRRRLGAGRRVAQPRLHLGAGLRDLRLLGVPAEDPQLQRARAWFLPHGGPLSSGSWGKFILAMLGLYEYRGLVPVPPELWLLPEALPLHPSKLWCHCRMVYLPMSWLYGRRVRATETPVLAAIRSGDLRPALRERGLAGRSRAGGRHRRVHAADLVPPRGERTARALGAGGSGGSARAGAGAGAGSDSPRGPGDQLHLHRPHQQGAEHGGVARRPAWRARGEGAPRSACPTTSGARPTA